MNVNKSKSYFVVHNKRENVHNISQEHCIDQCCVLQSEISWCAQEHFIQVDSVLQLSSAYTLIDHNEKSVKQPCIITSQ